jgi:hypothetical protein
VSTHRKRGLDVRLALAWVIGLLTLDLLAGLAAYGTPTWNLGHTQVLIGWAAVRHVCLIVVPVSYGVVTGAVALALWVLKGRS